VEVPFVTHTVDDHRYAAERAGLKLTGLFDVDVPAPGRWPFGGRMVSAAVIVHLIREVR
jgi:hypothetical protein